jgi:hypothetical protein
MRFVLALLITASCGMPVRDARDVRVSWTGAVTYESRHPTATGASSAIAIRPARFVDVVLLDASGSSVAEGRTDEEGRFAIDGPGDATTVRVFSRVRVRGHDVAVTPDGLGRETHYVDAALGAPEDRVAILALDQDGDAGAFHMVDTMLRGLDAVQEWIGVTLPPVFAYWLRGGTREWSFYRGERPAGSGRFGLELLGGEPGQASTSDTDEHDEAIVLHELGHFVMDRLTGDSSSGGMHPRGAPLDPGLAWEEGRATWFALSVLRDPHYMDTIGIEPYGELRVNEDVEVGEDRFPGISSETSVAKVLWDLTDGGDTGIPDQDNDGVALGPGAILRAMMELARVDGSFPCLSTFVEFLGQSQTSLRAMLVQTSMADRLPTDWPRGIDVGAVVEDRIDGVTQPAPSTGGPNLPTTGFDAMDTYRVRVNEVGMLVLRLEIQGSGRVADRQDLDLELLDMRAEAIAVSRTEEPRETVSRIVQPGWFIVRVRDGGQGNRAGYRLRVDLETLGGPSLPSAAP